MPHPELAGQFGSVSSVPGSVAVEDSVVKIAVIFCKNKAPDISYPAYSIVEQMFT